MLWIIIIGLFLGFLGLYYGSKLVVIGLENMALRFGISQLLIGLTILSIGTSLPEIAVSVMGGVDKIFGLNQGIDAIVIGNKVGSFLTQLTLIIGILGIVQPIFISRWKLKREGVSMAIALLIFFFIAIDGIITQFEALILIISYIIYLILIIYSERRVTRKQREIQEFLKQRDGIEIKETKPDCEERETPDCSLSKDIAYTVFGLLALIIGAEITLLSGHELAREFGIPENIVGIFILGLETSLPELIASIVAIRRDSFGIAVGDILGSNICDILLATGSGAIIVSFKVPHVLLVYEIPLLFIIIGVIFLFFWSKEILNRWEAGIMVGIFVGYAIFKFLFFQI
ncbi:MAG: calcium/sodium antiporter [Candidatus Lokiarchaeota archaeon]|nr:calcium/sodium antiporter [Candidatus Lokiarchaeota archaeon]